MSATYDMYPDYADLAWRKQVEATEQDSSYYGGIGCPEKEDAVVVDKSAVEAAIAQTSARAALQGALQQV